MFAMTDLARDAVFRQRIQEEVATLSKDAWYHSIELPGGRAVPGVVSLEALRARIGRYPIPQDLRGKRVLDVGAATGWNSFELERRGAEVVAVDCVEFREFLTARELLGSRVEYRILDVDELSPAILGRFDSVLFFGVLYHLRHPLLGLEKICALTRETAFVESFVTDGDGCSLEFYETEELGGQIDNWYGPTAKCLGALCRSAGFARVELEYTENNRAGLTCRRKWEPVGETTAAAPWLCSVVNNRTLEPRFRPAKDEYLCLYFRSGEPLERGQIRIEVDASGVPTLTLAGMGPGEWQANARVPPGLELGSHDVRIRTVNSAFGNALPISVMASELSGALGCTSPDEALGDGPAPTWVAVENTLDKTNTFRGYKAEQLSCRFLSAEAGLDVRDIVLELDGRRQAILVLADLRKGEWQTNSSVPSDLEPGRHEVRLRIAGGSYSGPAEIFYQPAHLRVKAQAE
jgi:SAM-dependent methyltransferase